MDRVKRIWYLSPMRAAKVQASLRIRAVSPEPSLLAHTRSESRGTFRQRARSLAPLNGWACAVKICLDGMLEDTNSLDAAQISFPVKFKSFRVFLITFVMQITCEQNSAEKVYSRKCYAPKFEPRQANLCLRAFRHDKFRLRMPSHSEGLWIWLSV